MKKTLFASVVILSCVFQSGCLYFASHGNGVFPQAKETGALKYETLGEAEGSSSEFRLFWLVKVTPDISYDEAVNEAVRSKGGDNLIGVTSWKEKKVYITGTVDILNVKGTVVRYIR